MKRSLLILAFLISVLSSIAQNIKLDEKNGFEHYIFGSSPSTYTDLSLEIEEGNVKLYTSSVKQSLARDINYENVSVTFNKNRLSAITIKSSGESAATFLTKLKEMYGEPNKSTKEKGKYEWQGKKVYLLYESNLKANQATINFYSKVIK